MMNRRFTGWCMICACLVVWPCSVQTALSQQTGNVENKDNPFASILKKQQYASTELVETPREYDTRSPDLVGETVTLSHVNAKTASDAFSCLSSEMGRIVPQENSNSLIVFDTPQNIKRIVAEIQKADRPIEALTLQYVGLTFMDANAVAEAVKNTASTVGSIIAVTQTNGLILCDTRINVEAMVTEIKRLDKPIAGMQMESITFEHVDALSAKEALTPLLSEHGLASIVKRTNSIVVCDFPKNLEKIRKEAQAIDKNNSGVVVEIVNLKFLQAQNLVTVLEKMLTPYGSAAANQSSNTIILCDTRENVTRIISEIKRADQSPPQIMVEVVLLDVRLGDDKEIGINWNMLSSDYRRRFNNTYAADTDPDTFYPWDGESNVGVAGGFDATDLGGAVSVVSGTVTAMVSAIQSTRDVQIIASPRALVLSGKTARIQAAEQVPYEVQSDTSQGGSMTSTEFKSVGVTLEVTATLADNGTISLNVSVEQSVRTGESVNSVPVVDSRSENTSLLLEDGQVVIMGGLRRREKTVQVTKVPLLGDLPMIGKLFKKQHDIIDNSELVVLLSPHIYKGQAVPQKVLDKYQELEQFAPITGTMNEK